MKVNDLVYKVCEYEAKTVTEDIILIDENIICPTPEYIENIYNNMLHKAAFEVAYGKIVIHKSESNNDIDNTSWLNLEIYDGYWIYATKANETESLIILKHCEQKNMAEFMMRKLEDYKLFDRVALFTDIKSR